jgi:hypothetical protein
VTAILSRLDVLRYAITPMRIAMTRRTIASALA